MTDACEGATFLWGATGGAIILVFWGKLIYREGRRSGLRERADRDRA